MFNVVIIIFSDKGYEGKREDIIGKKLIEFVENIGVYKVIEYVFIKDDKEMLKENIIRFCNSNKIDLIFINGGIGFLKRDIILEVIKEVLEKEILGLSEYMRMKFIEIIKKVILSRGVSGIRNNFIIINLFGSFKGVVENLSFIIDVLDYGIEVLRGEVIECVIKKSE